MLVPPENFGVVEPGLYRCSKLSTDNFPHLQTLNLKTILLLDAENPPRPLKNFISDNNINLINLGGLKVSNHNHTGADNVPNKDDDDTKSINDVNTSGSEAASPLLSQSYQSKNSNSTIDEPFKELNLQLINLNNTTKKNDQWMLIEKNLIKKAFEILLNKSKYNILIIDSTSTLISILRRIQKWNFNSIVNEFRIYTGHSAKSNYFAENFLELIEIELIPYEIDQINQLKSKKIQSIPLTQTQSQPSVNGNVLLTNALQPTISQTSQNDDLSNSPEIFKTSSWHKHSIDDESLWEKEMVDDDDYDDDLLSASPQIPENLLKMVEKKRNNSLDSDDDKLVTPGSSPRYIAGSGRYNDRRRPSDSKITRPFHNNMFRTSFSTFLPGSINSNRSSFDTARRYSRSERKSSLKIEDFNDFEEKRIREKFDFKYYKNLNKYSTSFANVGIIKLKLPPNNKLPDWFIRGRDFWEENYLKFKNS